LLRTENESKINQEALLKSNNNVEQLDKISGNNLLIEEIINLTNLAFIVNDICAQK
ncbi:6428_t:CDS:1, partial [Gigaspora margarita]